MSSVRSTSKASENGGKSAIAGLTGYIPRDATNVIVEYYITIVAGTTLRVWKEGIAPMNGIIWLVGAVVIVLVILSYLGLR
jgi:hypothetical protein